MRPQTAGEFAGARKMGAGGRRASRPSATRGNGSPRRFLACDPERPRPRSASTPSADCSSSGTARPSASGPEVTRSPSGWPPRATGCSALDARASLRGAADDIAALARRRSARRGPATGCSAPAAQALDTAVSAGATSAQPGIEQPAATRSRALRSCCLLAARRSTRSPRARTVVGARWSCSLAETGLRTNEWAALERRDVDRSGRACVVQRRFADGSAHPVPEDRGSRRRVPLGGPRARGALDAAAARLDTPLAVPRRRGRPHRPRRLAHPRVVPGARSGRTHAARALPDCGTPSPPRPSRPASRSSSWPA